MTKREQMMTPSEFRTALRAFRKSVGPKAYVSAGISDLSTAALSCSIYPFGVTKDEGYCCVNADDWAELLTAAEAEWSKHKRNFRDKTVRKMALAIIRITDELGACSDAALRHEFDTGQVADCGAEACALADTMAGKGPFTIIAVVGANAA